MISFIAQVFHLILLTVKSKISILHCYDAMIKAGVKLILEAIWV